eukprot:7811398-Pyramimonas_sp.AAC.1
MQNIERDDMLLTWFGMFWPGKCTSVAIGVLTEDSSTSHGEISAGTAATPFTTEEQAQALIRVADGLHTCYMQYPIHYCTSPNGQEMQLNLEQRPLEWHSTWLTAKLTIESNLRNVTYLISHRNLLGQAPKRRENMHWQAQLASCDFDQWAIHGHRWI